MDTIKTALHNHNTGVVSTFVGVGVSLTEIEIWLRILTLVVGLAIALINFFNRS